MHPHRWSIVWLKWDDLPCWRNAATLWQSGILNKIQTNARRVGHNWRWIPSPPQTYATTVESRNKLFARICWRLRTGTDTAKTPCTITIFTNTFHRCCVTLRALETVRSPNRLWRIVDACSNIPETWRRNRYLMHSRYKGTVGTTTWNISLRQKFVDRGNLKSVHMKFDWCGVCTNVIRAILLNINPLRVLVVEIHAERWGSTGPCDSSFVKFVPLLVVLIWRCTYVRLWARNGVRIIVYIGTDWKSMWMVVRKPWTLQTTLQMQLSLGSFFVCTFWTGFGFIGLMLFVLVGGLLLFLFHTL